MTTVFLLTRLVRSPTLPLNSGTVHTYGRCIALLGNPCPLDVNNRWFLIRLDANRSFSLVLSHPTRPISSLMHKSPMSIMNAWSMLQVLMCCSLSSRCLTRLRCASDLPAPRTQCTHQTTCGKVPSSGKSFLFQIIFCNNKKQTELMNSKTQCPHEITVVTDFPDFCRVQDHGRLPAAHISKHSLFRLKITVGFPPCTCCLVLLCVQCAWWCLVCCVLWWWCLVCCVCLLVCGLCSVCVVCVCGVCGVLCVALIGTRKTHRV